MVLLSPLPFAVRADHNSCLLLFLPNPSSSSVQNPLEFPLMATSRQEDYEHSQLPKPVSRQRITIRPHHGGVAVHAGRSRHPPMHHSQGEVVGGSDHTGFSDWWDHLDLNSLLAARYSESQSALLINRHSHSISDALALPKPKLITMYKSIHKKPVSQHGLWTGIWKSSGSHGSADQNSGIHTLRSPDFKGYDAINSCWLFNSFIETGGPTFLLYSLSSQ